jgi:hypothetical protein
VPGLKITLLQQPLVWMDGPADELATRPVKLPEKVRKPEAA